MDIFSFLSFPFLTVTATISDELGFFLSFSAGNPLLAVEVVFEPVDRVGTNGTGFATSFLAAAGFAVAFAPASWAWVGSVNLLMVRVRTGAAGSGLGGREVVEVVVLAVLAAVDAESTLGFADDSVLLRTGGLEVGFAAVEVEDETGGLAACEVVGAAVGRLGPGLVAGLLVLASGASLVKRDGSGRSTLLAPPTTLCLAGAVGS